MELWIGERARAFVKFKYVEDFKKAWSVNALWSSRAPFPHISPPPAPHLHCPLTGRRLVIRTKTQNFSAPIGKGRVFVSESNALSDPPDSQILHASKPAPAIRPVFSACPSILRSLRAATYSLQSKILARLR